MTLTTATGEGGATDGEMDAEPANHELVGPGSDRGHSDETEGNTPSRWHA